MRHGLVLILTSISLLLPVVHASTTTVSQIFDALIDIERETAGRLSTLERAAAMAAAFDKVSASRTMRSMETLDSEDLKMLFRSADLTHNHTLREQDITVMELALSELINRGIDTQRNRVDMYGAYISMRMFTDAQHFADKHGIEVDRIAPSIVSEVPENFHGRTLLKVSLTNNKLTHTSFVPGLSDYIIVISHPLCHFTRDAVSAIEQDSTLSKIFSENSFWIAPVDRNVHFETLQAWNLKHSGAEFSVAYRREDWQQIDYWGTPTFYFFKDNKMIEKVTGWPDSGRREELIQAARSIGLDL